MQTWLRFPIKHMKSVLRWGRFKMHSISQDVLQHTYEQTLLTITALIIEASEDERIKPFAVTVCAIVHDLGERPKRKKRKPKSKQWRYDIAVTDKATNSNPEALRDIERKVVYDYFDRLPIAEKYKSLVIDFLVSAYEIQYETKNINGEFFNILEQLGYILHAYEEYMKHKYYEYDEVFQNNHYNVSAACKKFKSIKVIYEPYIDEIEKALQTKSPPK